MFVSCRHVRAGSSVAYSGTTLRKLVEASHYLDRAFEADNDATDSEPDPCARDPFHNEREGVDSAVANPNDGQQDVADPAVADPAVADPDVADSYVAEQGGSSCDGTQQPRKVVSESASKKLYARRGPMQVFRMTEHRYNDLPNDIYTYGPTAALRGTHWEHDDDNNPCRYHMRDVHMATYVLGAKADANELSHRLKATGIPIVVLVFTELVSISHDIFKALKRWAKLAAEFNGTQPPEGSEAMAVLTLLHDKRIVALGEREDIFVCIHTDRVRTAIFEERVLSCREQEGDQDIQFGTLTVFFHEGGCDPGDYLRLGIVVARFRLTPTQTDALSQWIILHRLAVLTGFLPRSGDNRIRSSLTELTQADGPQGDEDVPRDSPLTELAKKSRAIGSKPLFQLVDLACYLDEQHIWALPVPWLFFGYEKAIKQPVSVARIVLDSELDLGSDVYEEVMSYDQMPHWTPNTDGHAFVPFLDVIRVTPIDWECWFDGCAMTAVRIGKSRTPRGHGQHPRRLESRHLQRGTKRRIDHDDEESN